MSVEERDLGWFAIRAKLKQLAAREVTVGFHEGSRSDGSGLTNATVAAFHEYGLGVPQRAFIGPTMDENAPELGRFAAQQAREVVAGKSVGRAVAALGQKSQQMVQKTLREKRPEWAPLTEETKRRKAAKGRLAPAVASEFVAGDGNPLIDTGQLINSVTWEAKKRG